MGNTTASLTREQLVRGGVTNRENRPRHQTGRALYRNLHDAHRMRPNDSGQQLDGRSSL